MIIATAQMKIEYSNVEKNLKKIKEMTEKAHKSNSDIICFPEDCLGIINKETAALAQRIPGKYTDEFSKLAEEFGIYMVAGSVCEKDGDDFYNTSVLIGPDGKIIGKYRKIHLWDYEKQYLKPGNKISVFNTKLGKIGLEICWDLAFPEQAKQMAMRGAEVIFCPSFWSLEDNPLIKTKYKFDTESMFIDACVASRAWENEIVFVFANSCGRFVEKNKMIHPVGHTQIAIPFYGTVGKISNREGILIKEIDKSVLKEAEKVYRIKEDSK